jgi:cytochrome c biogenesis protein CcmG, thiol:disulfide interchange protein DsbE
MPEDAPTAAVPAQAGSAAGRRGLLRCAVLGLPLAWRPSRAAPPAPARWPALELLGASGAPLLPAVGDGRVTHVDFWASWCTPCRLSFPWMNQVHERWAAGGLRIVAINVDRRRADALRFLAQVPARFEIAFDPAGDVARRLDIQAMPSSLLVGRDGAILSTHRGFRPADVPLLEQQLRDALA